MFYQSDTAGLSTLGVVHPCRSVKRVTDIGQLPSLVDASYNPLFIGGGSNILFTSPIDRDIIVVDHRGINIIDEDKKYVFIEVAAGTPWQELVNWAVDKDYGGIENLSLIPGKCGAAPMQNIGAYGVEIQDVLESVQLLHLERRDWLSMNNAQCQFGYRDSIFKNELKERVVITSIVLKLTKPRYHTINIEYGAIKDQLEVNGQKGIPNIQEVSNAVTQIRQSKLPDPAVLPNAGSFFKNPIVPKPIYDSLHQHHGAVPFYPVDSHNVKIPAGWLIDQCGWKGKQIGSVGTYEKQALVIVNHGTQDGQAILDFSKTIQKSVFDRFKINIQPEVNIY